MLPTAPPRSCDVGLGVAEIAPPSPRAQAFAELVGLCPDVGDRSKPLQARRNVNVHLPRPKGVL